MKTKSKPLEASDPGFDSESFWRHYVATVDGDQGWAEERPQHGKGSNRLFLFLLLFHIFLIGSVVLYNLVSERPRPVFADGSAPARPAASTAKSSPAASAAPASQSGETIEHRVAVGDSLKSIADASGATQEEIAKLNNIDVSTQLAVGSVLLVPKPKARPAPTVLPAPVTPSRVDESVVTIQPTTAAEARIFTAVEPAASSRKTETLATHPPAEVSKAKIEDTPPAAITPSVAVKVEDSPPAAAPKPTESKAMVRTETSTPPATKPAKPVTTATATSKPAEPAKSAPAPATATKAVASGATHTVKPGDTFYSIARKHGVKLDDLMRVNGMPDPAKLREGTVLKLPAKK
jgi:LysM repeat protein